MFTTVRPPSSHVNPTAALLAAAEHLADFPSLTVGEALDALSLSLDGLPADLIDLPGAIACEAIEAELLVLSVGWAPAHREAA